MPVINIQKFVNLLVQGGSYNRRSDRLIATTKEKRSIPNRAIDVLYSDVRRESTALSNHISQQKRGSGIIDVFSGDALMGIGMGLVVLTEMIAVQGQFPKERLGLVYCTKYQKRFDQLQAVLGLTLIK